MRIFNGSGLLAMLIGCGLAGCAVTALDGQRMGLKSDGYADYVSEVFRQQSDVSTGITFALADEDPGSTRFLQLEDADLDILTACRGINELASEQQAGQRARGLSAMKRARQVPDCERATRQGAAVLGQ